MLDIIVIAVVLGLAVRGAFRGLISEVFTLIAIVGGIFLGSRFSLEFGQLITSYAGFIEGETSIKLVGFCVFFLVFWAVMFLLEIIVKKFLIKGSFKIVDKIGGAVFGGLKVFLILAIVFYAAGSVKFIANFLDGFTAKSHTYKPLFATGKFIVSFDSAKDLQKELYEKTQEITQDANEAMKEKIQDLSDEDLNKIKETINKLSPEQLNKILKEKQGETND